MTLLEAYLTLERVMLEFDRAKDPIADQIRDVMDPLWLRMSQEDRAKLKARGRVTP